MIFLEAHISIVLKMVIESMQERWWDTGEPYLGERLNVSEKGSAKGGGNYLKRNLVLITLITYSHI